MESSKPCVALDAPPRMSNPTNHFDAMMREIWAMTNLPRAARLHANLVAVWLSLHPSEAEPAWVWWRFFVEEQQEEEEQEEEEQEKESPRKRARTFG